MATGPRGRGGSMGPKRRSPGGAGASFAAAAPWRGGPCSGAALAAREAEAREAEAEQGKGAGLGHGGRLQ